MDLTQASFWVNLINAVWTAGRNGRDLVLGPKLTLALAPSKTGATADRPGIEKYRHLIVTNAHRSKPAHNVQVFLTRIAERVDQTEVVLWDGEEIRLFWAWERNEEGSPKSRTVGPPARCDLLAIARDNRTIRLETISASANFADGSLESAPRSRASREGGFYLLPKRTYVVTFIARSDETDSEECIVEMCWNGGWTDDEQQFSKLHLSLKEPHRGLVRFVPRPRRERPGA